MSYNLTVCKQATKEKWIKPLDLFYDVKHKRSYFHKFTYRSFANYVKLPEATARRYVKTWIAKGLAFIKDGNLNLKSTRYSGKQIHAQSVHQTLAISSVIGQKKQISRKEQLKFKGKNIDHRKSGSLNRKCVLSLQRIAKMYHVSIRTANSIKSKILRKFFEFKQNLKFMFLCDKDTFNKCREIINYRFNCYTVYYNNKVYKIGADQIVPLAVCNK